MNHVPYMRAFHEAGVARDHHHPRDRACAATATRWSPRSGPTTRPAGAEERRVDQVVVEHGTAPAGRALLRAEAAEPQPRRGRLRGAGGRGRGVPACQPGRGASRSTGSAMRWPRATSMRGSMMRCATASAGRRAAQASLSARNAPVGADERLTRRAFLSLSRSANHGGADARDRSSLMLAGSPAVLHRKTCRANRHRPVLTSSTPPMRGSCSA